MWLPFTTYAEILNTKTKIRIQSKYKYAGNRVWDCHTLLAQCSQWQRKRQRQKMRAIEYETATSLRSSQWQKKGKIRNDINS